MRLIRIEQGSEAFAFLARAFAAAGTYAVNIDDRPDGLAVKVNAGMWSPALDTAASEIAR